MEEKEWIFTQAKNPKDYFFAAGFLAFLACFSGVALVFESTIPMSVIGNIAYSLIFLLTISPILVMFCIKGLIKVKLSCEGVVIYLGKWELKRIEAKQICTIAKGYSSLEKKLEDILYVSDASPDEIESEGEKALGKSWMIRNSMKFRKDKADWKDLCLGAGLVSIKGAIRIEFTEERKQLLLELFPDAEYREGKHINDPSSSV